MSDIIEEQVTDLVTEVSKFSADNGLNLLLEIQRQAEPLLVWMQYLCGSQKTAIADEVLIAAAASIRESAACACLGLVRPALFSLRTHVDLVLAWLYFKDHPVEWMTVNNTGNGFKMKQEVLIYLENNYSGFNERLALLKKFKSRSYEDTYRLLSAHVHAQSTSVLPIGANLKDVVHSADLAMQLANLVGETAEYVGDILSSIYSKQWAALPATVKASVENRLAQHAKSSEIFFSSI